MMKSHSKYSILCDDALHNKVILFIINFCILLIVYSVMYVVPHYSTDTYTNYLRPSNNNIQINMQHGRYVAAGLYWLFEMIHFDYSQLSFLGSVILFSVLAGGTSLLTIRFLNAADLNNFSQCITLDAIMLTLAINLSVMELQMFPDILYSISLCFAFCFSAILFWCKSDRTTSDCLLSFLFLSLCLDIYQVCIGMYVILSMAYVFIDKKFASWWDIVRQIMILLLIGLLASFQSLVLMKLPQLLDVSTAEYVTSLSVQQVLKNAITIWQAQRSQWFGFNGFLPKAVPGVFIIVAIISLVVISFQKRIQFSVKLIMLIGIIGSWIMSYAPYFIAADIWMPPRTMVSMFAFIALPGIWVWAIGNDHVKKYTAILYAGLLIIMSISVQRVAINNYAVNAIDQEICNIISQKIAAYESENDIQVDTIAVGRDNATTWGYSSTEYSIFDTNIRSFCSIWSDVSIIEFYTGRSFKRITMTQEEYSRIFNDRSWDYFDSHEQIRFNGSIMYLAIY